MRRMLYTPLAVSPECRISAQSLKLGGSCLGIWEISGGAKQKQTVLFVGLFPVGTFSSDDVWKIIIDMMCMIVRFVLVLHQRERGGFRLTVAVVDQS